MAETSSQFSSVEAHDGGPTLSLILSAKSKFALVEMLGLCIRTSKRIQIRIVQPLGALHYFIARRSYMGYHSRRPS